MTAASGGAQTARPTRLPRSARRKQLLAAGAKSTAIYLGDNIYENGMPEEGASDRKESERRIVDQLNVDML